MPCGVPNHASPWKAGVFFFLEVTLICLTLADCSGMKSSLFCPHAGEQRQKNSSGSFSKGRWCLTGRSQGLAARQLHVGLLDLPRWTRGGGSSNSRNLHLPSASWKHRKQQQPRLPAGHTAVPPASRRPASPSALRVPRTVTVSGPRKPRKARKTHPGEIPHNSSVGSCEQTQVQSRLAIDSASQRRLHVPLTLFTFLRLTIQPRALLCLALFLHLCFPQERTQEREWLQEEQESSVFSFDSQICRPRRELT